MQPLLLFCRLSSPVSFLFSSSPTPVSLLPCPVPPLRSLVSLLLLLLPFSCYCLPFQLSSSSSQISCLLSPRLRSLVSLLHLLSPTVSLLLSSFSLVQFLVSDLTSPSPFSWLSSHVYTFFCLPCPLSFSLFPSPSTLSHLSSPASNLPSLYLSLFLSLSRLPSPSPSCFSWFPSSFSFSRLPSPVSRLPSPVSRLPSPVSLLPHLRPSNVSRVSSRPSPVSRDSRLRTFKKRRF
jgi:hypothetical protein